MITTSGSKRAACGDRLGHRAGLGNDLEAGAAVEQRDEALAHDLVVVDDEEAERALHGAYRSRPVILVAAAHRGGRMMMIRVPDPGRCSTSKPAAEAPRPARACWPGRGDRARPHPRRRTHGRHRRARGAARRVVGHGRRWRATPAHGGRCCSAPRGSRASSSATVSMRQARACAPASSAGRSTSTPPLRRSSVARCPRPSVSDCRTRAAPGAGRR